MTVKSTGNFSHPIEISDEDWNGRPPHVNGISHFAAKLDVRSDDAKLLVEGAIASYLRAKGEQYRARIETNEEFQQRKKDKVVADIKDLMNLFGFSAIEPVMSNFEHELRKILPSFAQVHTQQVMHSRKTDTGAFILFQWKFDNNERGRKLSNLPLYILIYHLDALVYMKTGKHLGGRRGKAKNFVMSVCKIVEPSITPSAISHGLRIVKDSIVPALYSDPKSIADLERQHRHIVMLTVAKPILNRRHLQAARKLLKRKQQSMRPDALREYHSVSLASVGPAP